MSNIFRKISLVGLILLIFGTALISPAMAWEHQEGDRIVISKDQVINDDLFLAGQDIIVDGTIEGDLMVFGETVTVNGKVNGDVLGASRVFSFNGEGNDDLRVAAQEIRINGSIKRNITAAANQLYVEKGAAIGSNATIGAERAVIQGPIQGKLQGGAQYWEIANLIGGDITVGAKRLTIGPGADIGGKVQYTSTEKAIISPEAKIAGEVAQIIPVEKYPAEKKQETPVSKVIWFLVKFASLLILWYIWQYLSPKSFVRLQQTLRDKVGPSFGWGLVLLFLIPIIAILLMITVVGLPISIFGLIGYAAIIYLSRIIVGYRFGELILVKIGRDDFNKPVIMAAVGICSIMLLSAIPYLGFWVGLVVVILGFGSVFLAIQGKDDKQLER